MQLSKLVGAGRAVAIAGLLVAAPVAAHDEASPEGEAVADLAAEGAALPQVLFHPVYDEPAMCSEHGLGTLKGPGDALGQDCLVVSGIDFATNTGFMTFHRGDGSRNEDWFGWTKPVLSPLAGTIKSIHRNDALNVPGTMTPGRAASILVVAPDGTMAVIAHLGSFAVAEGDTVQAGQVIGTVGNNGFARSPHVHVAAITAEGQPAQIRWNLAAVGKLSQTYIARIRSTAGAEKPQ